MEKRRKFKHKIVVIEYNQCLGSNIYYASNISTYDVELSTERTDANKIDTRTDPVRGCGSSFRSLVELGENKGYTLVTATRLNLVFVRNELISQIEQEIKEPIHYYRDDWSEKYCDPVNRNIFEIIYSSIQDDRLVRTIKKRSFIPDVIN